MDPVSNVDQIALILRQRLLERSRADAAAGKDRRGSAQRARAGGLDKLKAVAALEAIDERQLRRTLIQNILADQFGPELVNEAKFQQVVDRVADTIADDEQASKLLSRLIADLRG